LHHGLPTGFRLDNFHESDKAAAVTELAESPNTEGINEGAVGAWIEAHTDALGPFSYDRVAGGRSNLTYIVTDGAGQRLVLRRPPLSHVIAKAHDMGREHRVIAALHQTGLPIPQALGLCTDHEVNGADFYAMEFIDGVVPHTEADVESITDRPALSHHVVEVLAGLHAVDPDSVGLGNLGRGVDYLARQLNRWNKAWEYMKQRDLPAMDQAYRRLNETIPEQQAVAIAHGDYRLGNMLVANNRVVGLLDWELCTLGDPIADLGYLINNWAEAGEHAEWSSAPTAAGGFASRDEMVSRYTDLTGFDVDNIDYYRAFAYWRMGCIVEGVYARFLQGAYGQDHGEDVQLFADAVVKMSDAALSHL